MVRARVVGAVAHPGAGPDAAVRVAGLPLPGLALILSRRSVVPTRPAVVLTGLLLPGTGLSHVLAGPAVVCTRSSGCRRRGRRPVEHRRAVLGDAPPLIPSRVPQVRERGRVARVPRRRVVGVVRGPRRTQTVLRAGGDGP